MLLRPMRFCNLRLCRLLLMLVPAAAPAQVPEDAPDRSSEVETTFRFYPAPLWSRTSGFAAGVGYEIENFPFRNTSLQATAIPGQHLGRYALSYFVGDAYEDIAYGAANLYYEATGRQWYYGMHATSSADDEIAFEKEMVEAELRLGLRPLGGRLLIQPMAAYVRHQVHGFEAFSEGAVERLSPLSTIYLFYSAGERGAPDVQEGGRFGIAAAVDLRDRPARPRSGLLVQGSAQRFRSPESNVKFDFFRADVNAFVPVGDNVIAVRLVGMNVNHLTRTRIPFYVHPRLDSHLLPGYSRDRFHGNDLLVVTAEYAMPLFQIPDFAALDALVSLGAGNVYFDLFREFKPAITFDEEVRSSDEYPLRPSAAIGFNLQGYDVGGWEMRVLLGWGTEGVQLVRFGFVQDVRRLSPWNR